MEINCRLDYGRLPVTSRAAAGGCLAISVQFAAANAAASAALARRAAFERHLFYDKAFG